MKKKILALSSILFSFPLVAWAGGMFVERCGYGGSMGMHHSMLWLFVLVVMMLAVWTVVGVLAAIWLWGHISGSRKRRGHSEE